MPLNSDNLPRLGDRYLLALAWCLLGYAVLGRSFAYMGLPPLFIGEMLYLAGLLLLIRSRCLLATLASFPNVILLALGLWAIIRTIPFISVHGLDALRDSAMVLYGAFAIIVAALLIERPDRLHHGLRLFSAFAAMFGAIAAIAYAAQTLLGNRGLLPAWPNSGLPLLSVKPGDVAVHLTGSAVFALLFFRRISWTWVCLLVAGMSMVAVHNRGGLLAMALPIGVALALSGRVRELSGLFSTGLLIVIVAYLLDLDFAMMERDRPLSVEQLLQNLLSVFGHSDDADLDGTRTWRLLWWQAILDYTIHGPYFWTGKGFGIPLAAADGFAGVTPPDAPELRSPHNITMTILARTGVPGLLLWVTLLLAWFGMTARNALLAIRRADWLWFRLFLFLGCYVAAALINASFDVALEGPMLGIWFWVLFGFSTAASLIYRTERTRRPRAAHATLSHGRIAMMHPSPRL